MKEQDGLLAFEGSNSSVGGRKGGVESNTEFLNHLALFVKFTKSA